MNILRGEIPKEFSGDGSGDGYGYGYGYGYGSGDGYGYGYGYGSGSGDGYGYGSYWTSTIKYFSKTWSAAQLERMEALSKAGAKIAFWRSDAAGRAANGGRCDPVKVGTVHTEKGPLALCAKGTLHATLIPPKWKGERWWIVALTGPIVGTDEKYGALSREILGECQ